MKERKLTEEIKCLCVRNRHSLRLFVHDDRTHSERQRGRGTRSDSLQSNSFAHFSPSQMVCVLSREEAREKKKAKNSIVRITRAMQQWNHPIIIQNSGNDGMPTVATLPSSSSSRSSERFSSPWKWRMHTYCARFTIADEISPSRWIKQRVIDVHIHFEYLFREIIRIWNQDRNDWSIEG